MACCRKYPRYLRSWTAQRAMNQAEACVAGKIQPGDLDRGYADRGSMAVAEWLVEPDGPTCSSNIVRDLREREGEKVIRRILPLLWDIFRFEAPAALPHIGEACRNGSRDGRRLCRCFGAIPCSPGAIGYPKACRTEHGDRDKSVPHVYPLVNRHANCRR